MEERQFQAPGEPREKATHTSWSVTYSKQGRPKMCGHRGQTHALLILRSPQISFISGSYIRTARICTDDTQASRLQVKGRQYYLSQNIGPAVARSAGPAPPPLL